MRFEFTTEGCELFTRQVVSGKGVVFICNMLNGELCYSLTRAAAKRLGAK